jgi:hypothetical protein
MNNSVNTWEDIGYILHNIVHPLPMLQRQFFLCKSKTFTAHIGKPKPMTLGYIFRNAHCGTGTALIQFQAEERIAEGF